MYDLGLANAKFLESYFASAELLVELEILSQRSHISCILHGFLKHPPIRECRTFSTRDRIKSWLRSQFRKTSVSQSSLSHSQWVLARSFHHTTLHLVGSSENQADSITISSKKNGRWSTVVEHGKVGHVLRQHICYIRTERMKSATAR